MGLSILVHLLGKDGEMITPETSPPALGASCCGFWRPGLGVASPGLGGHLPVVSTNKRA